MKLSHAQQHLLSYLNLVHVSLAKDAEIFINKIIEQFPDLHINDLTQEIYHINQVIKQYDLEIVQCVDEITSETLLILINTANDKVSQNAKFYDKNSMRLLSEIIKDCILSENRQITEMHCLNLSIPGGISKFAAQNMIEIFVKDKWLNSKNGILSLGMRTILELQQNIKECYPNEINDCSLCKVIVIQGYYCKHCNIRFHFSCIKKYYSHSNSVYVCLKCKGIFINSGAEWQN